MNNKFIQNIELLNIFLLQVFLFSDKPDAPSGQLAVSDIKAKSLKLNWNSPIDHMTKVDGYVIEMKGLLMFYLNLL